MGSLLFVVAAVLFVASLVVLVVALRRPRKAAEPAGRQDPLAADAMPQFGPRQLGPRQLGPGAIVSHGGVDYVVRGSVTIHEIRSSGGDICWKAVDGVLFHESERGHASYTTEGTTGLPAGGEMEFVDCADADETALPSFERWAPDMPWEVSTGKPALPGELTVYPAPPPSSP